MNQCTNPALARAVAQPDGLHGTEEQRITSIARVRMGWPVCVYGNAQSAATYLPCVAKSDEYRGKLAVRAGSYLKTNYGTARTSRTYRGLPRTK